MTEFMGATLLQTSEENDGAVMVLDVLRWGGWPCLPQKVAGLVVTKAAPKWKWHHQLIAIMPVKNKKA
ncbi:hypothetical protein SR858_21155 [Duganella zoogloeoides]|uniref:Uncharacterized protein n=1 Tax=Duganella zoogloeoides TaxID=75659 RepID=A0ABZ0XUW2_9BURK|nr:hypothetical protein [Duganella zoogloeoides]WQH03537.1 hypothetical protein SR858_21155 [Duganella zoogloeoides]